MVVIVLLFLLSTNVIEINLARILSWSQFDSVLIMSIINLSRLMDESARGAA